MNHFYSQIICLGAHIQRLNKRSKKFYQIPPKIFSALPVQWLEQTMASQLTHFCSFSSTWWHWPSPPRWPDKQGIKRCGRCCRGMQGCIVQALHSKCALWDIFWYGICCSTVWLYFIICVTAGCVSRKQKGRCLMWDAEVGFWGFCLFGFVLVFFYLWILIYRLDLLQGLIIISQQQASFPLKRETMNQRNFLDESVFMWHVYQSWLFEQKENRDQSFYMPTRRNKEKLF